MSKVIGADYLRGNLKPAMELCIAVGITPPAALAVSLGAGALYLEHRLDPIFIQERLGQALQPIDIVKLRTFPFKNDFADRSNGDSDDRALPIARLIRKAKVDDLAMLWNFYKGDIALVGPRPVVQSEVEATYDVLSVSERTDWQRARTIAKAGAVSLFNMTSRQLDPMSDTYLLARVEADLEYVESASAGVDLAILADAVGGAIGTLSGRIINAAEEL